VTLEKAAQAYWAHLESRGQLAVCKSSRTWLRGFVKFCGGRGVSEVTELGAGILAAYRQELLWTPGPGGAMYKEGTLFQAQRMVRLFLRWLHESELVLVDHAASWILRRPPDSARNVPTVDQVSRLLLVPDARTPVGLRNRAILELLYGTGIRAHECYAIDLDSLDLEGSSLHVHGKGSKDRLLPLGPCLRQSLRRYLAARDKLGAVPSEQALFVSRGGARLGLNSLDQVVRKAARAVGIAGFGPHTLRHAFAVHLLESGADVAYIRVLLGHESLQSTAIYTRVHPLELFREHRRTHPRAKRKGTRRKRSK
jgi:site-specific recombinase XerD